MQDQFGYDLFVALDLVTQLDVAVHFRIDVIRALIRYTVPGDRAPRNDDIARDQCGDELDLTADGATGWFCKQSLVRSTKQRPCPKADRQVKVILDLVARVAVRDPVLSGDHKWNNSENEEKEQSNDLAHGAPPENFYE